MAEKRTGSETIISTAVPVAHEGLEYSRAVTPQIRQAKPRTARTWSPDYSGVM